MDNPLLLLHILLNIMVNTLLLFRCLANVVDTYNIKNLDPSVLQVHSPSNEVVSTPTVLGN